MSRLLVASSALALVAGSALANNSDFGNLVEWTFQTVPPVGPGPHAADGGIFAGTSNAFAITGGTVDNPVGNGSSESLSSNNWNVGDYFEFRTSSLGYENLFLSWDQVRSSTGPGTFDLVVSTDGMSFATLLDDYTVRVNSSPNWSTGGPRVTMDINKLAIPAAYDNQALLIFRLVSQVDAASAGTCRVDNVFLNGTLIPTPGTLALLGAAGLVVVRRQRG